MIEVLDYIFEPIQNHEVSMLMGVVKRLKQSDGEGWAVGEMLERALKVNAYGEKLAKELPDMQPKG